MPYIGKHMDIIDTCEILLDLLEEELDISGVEIVEPKKKITRREKARIAKRVMANFSFPVTTIRTSYVLYRIGCTVT